VPTRSLRVVVVAEESAGVQVLRGLATLQDPPEIVAVLSSPGEGSGRRAVVAETARAQGLDLWPSKLVREPQFAERLRRAEVDLLLNVHSLFLIHPDVVQAPGIGSFNLHPGPLPEYAGLNVPSWAVYNGERSHAVTLHWLDAGIDSGPIAWDQPFEIEEGDTGLAVSGKCVRHGVPLVMKLLDVAARDPSAIPRTEQDRARRNYFAAGPPDEGRLDWSRPAAEILRFVRASDYAPFRSPWGHPQAELAGDRVGIAKASPTGLPASGPPGSVREITDSGVTVSTGDELILVERVSKDSRYLRPREFLED
jgi:methionyl-tRNA formyltransferase